MEWDLHGREHWIKRDKTDVLRTEEHALESGKLL